MALNSLGDEKRQQPASVTLPKFALTDIAIEIEAREAAARVAERKIIRAGVDAWQAIGKADSFEAWKIIGAALAVGKAHALKVTGANAAWGRNYSRVFCDWMKEHHFDRMPKSTRSVAIELHENISSIEQWRATLTDKQRRRCVHPLSNVSAWRKATQNKPKCADDAVKAAAAAWRRFVSCVEALPPDQAAPFWQAAQAAIYCHAANVRYWG
jgi:hypothetical protein